ncbi:protein arginine n-methyltransferase, putative [Ricinus communis]|uniref:Protein arginine n-methyltransferase, putative n=1 Tax=Ricinus communis TaxID=3988 RepID=B9SEM3_RICCO|nr:protein arginine n-methyltransferase, putative [Ricinus communis]
MGSHHQDGERSGGSNGVVVDKGVDFAQYFCTYAFLYHQKEMLSDRVRMDAYYRAIFENKHHFHGKAVLDVGTGSGILAIWSAQAGARKVYAVEATKMAEHARALVKANNLQDVVDVIEGSIEDPTGTMYPSHARMWIAPLRSGLGDQKKGDYIGAMDDWFDFLDDTKINYGVDMSVLTQPFEEEQRKYYLQTSLWQNLHPNQVIGTTAIVKEIDCLTATVDDILNIRSNVMSSITMQDTRLSAFGGWFDVHFRGRGNDPARQEIELTTAPSIDNGTHWGQQVFVVHPPVHINVGDNLSVSFMMNRSKENHRLMEVEIGCEISQPSGKPLPPFRNKFYIE